jgi:hypothetical protein
MATIEEAPGLFREGIPSERLAQTFGVDLPGVDTARQKEIRSAIARVEGRPSQEVVKEIAQQFGLPGTFLGFTPSTVRSQLEQLLTQVPTQAETLGLAAAEQIAAPSIFEQLDLVNRAKELTTLPGFDKRTTEQEALIQELIGITGGATAVRGLGAPTAGALASQIAPQLQQFRQQEIQNRLAALQGLAGVSAVGAPERLGEIQSLLDLVGLSMPTPIVETGGGAGGGGFADILGGFGALGLGLGPTGLGLFGTSQVAKELF